MNVSSDYLVRMIGLLHIENTLLRDTVAQLQPPVLPNGTKREATKEELQEVLGQGDPR